MLAVVMPLGLLTSQVAVVEEAVSDQLAEIFVELFGQFSLLEKVRPAGWCGDIHVVGVEILEHLDGSHQIKFDSTFDSVQRLGFV